MSGTLSIGGKQIFSHSDVTDKVTYGSGVPAGTVIQTKIIKDSAARGGFGSQGDTYTGVNIAFDNDLLNTNSVVLIESSLQVDIQNNISFGMTWASSSSTLSGNKIGVDGSTVQNFTQGSTEYASSTFHGGHYTFFAYDANITSTTPKTYYLWVTNPHTDNIYLNTHTNHGQAQSLGSSSYYVGAATAVFKITEIAG